MNFRFRLFLITIIFLLYFGNANSQDYWSVINSPTSKTLTDCSFINSNTGWISGDSGVIIKTTNGGTNWIVQNSGTFNNIEDMYFLNERLGWAVAFVVFPDSNQFLGTLLLKTTNGGDTWQNSMYPDTNQFLTSVFYQDSLKGFLGGIGATIVITTNNGISWTNTDTDSTLFLQLPVFKIRFFDENLGYACGGFRDIAGTTWVTTNGGYNWRGIILAPEPFFDITILNDQKTICSGGDLEFGSSIARTTNQGNNWFYDTLGVFGLSFGISHRTQSEIWMASGYAQKFLYSLDTGITWTPLETPENTTVFDVQFTDTIYGYACGTNGTVLKFDRTMSSVSNGLNNIYPAEFRLYQNFPNPFNPVTKINYQLSGIQNGFNKVELKVFDVLGNEIALLVNDDQKAGNYEVLFDAADFPSGIYFYSLRVNGSIVNTRKMILLK